MNQTADIFTEFKPRDYLNYYYKRIDEENQALLEFFAEAYKDVPQNSKMMEFSGGPTIYQIITAANHVEQVDFSDYLQANLNEIKLWKSSDPSAFNWDRFIKEALKIEGLPASGKDIKNREHLVRKKINKLILGDAFMTDPCGPEYRNYYDVLGVSFVPEGITDSKDIWQSAISNIASLLKPGGLLAMAAILEAKFWMSGPQVLPAVYLKEENFRKIFPKLGLSIQKLTTIPSEILDPKDPGYTGYKGMVFIKATKA